jgi:hypothetical protein
LVEKVETMKSEPLTLRPYNGFWRKLQRRCLVPRFPLFLRLLLLPVALIPALAVVAYMLRDQGWGGLVKVTSVLWLLLDAFLLLFFLLLQLLQRKTGQMQAQPRTVATFLSPLSLTVTIGALLLGRVDVAIYVTYSGGAILALAQYKKKGRMSVVTVLINGVLLAAFTAGSIWMFLLLLALRSTWQLRYPPLLEDVRKKPSQQEFVEKARKACAAGGG